MPWARRMQDKVNLPVRLYWRDGGTLARHAASRSKDNDIAFMNLGLWQVHHGMVDEGIVSFRAALKTMGGPAQTPEVLVAALADASGTNVLGESWRKTILDTGPKKANACAEIFNNLGLALAMKGRADDAILHYRAALQIRPEHGKALNNLAFELAARGQHEQAIPLYEAAVRAEPAEAEMRRNFGRSLLETGRFADAARQYEEAARLSPRSAQGTFLEACRDHRVWALFVVYGACFGIELTINNVAVLYFIDSFEAFKAMEPATALKLAGLVASLFGLMNIFARTLGGMFGDRCGNAWGLAGRVPAAHLGAVCPPAFSRALVMREQIWNTSPHESHPHHRARRARAQPQGLRHRAPA